MKVLFNENAKTPLYSGVKLIGDAVATTFGPNGKNVIIKNRAGVHITKDGATVAKYVQSYDEDINAGIQILKDIAVKTAKDVGDGTTSSVILARAIIDELKNSDLHPIDILRILEQDTKKVVDYLEKNKIDIDSLEDLIKVATLSANNDAELGKLIATAYYRVGKDGVVNMGRSNDTKDSITYSEGVQIESGYISFGFINTDKNTCELDDVLVYISEVKLTELKQVVDICNKAIKENKSLLILAPAIDSLITTMLLNNLKKLNSCAIITPHYGKFRDMMVKDLNIILGESMTCSKVVIDKDTTTFIGCSTNQVEKEKEVELIKSLLNQNILEEPEIPLYKQRLANYIGGVATINIGGYSEVEILEKKDRVEDAIAAVKAAYDGGVLPGGGSALSHAAETLDLQLLRNVIKTPFRILSENSNVGEVILNTNFWNGFNFKNKQNGNMYEMGIIDPFLVTKTALENAITAASLILTNGCLIINME